MNICKESILKNEYFEQKRTKQKQKSVTFDEE